jgi:hypothetical protein
MNTGKNNQEELKRKKEEKRRSEVGRQKWSQITQEIDGCLYDTYDPETQLICETGPGYAYHAEEREPAIHERLYRTRGGEYFIHKRRYASATNEPTDEIEPVATGTAHHYMDHDRYDQYITEDQKREIKRDDKRRHDERNK